MLLTWHAERVSALPRLRGRCGSHSKHRRGRGRVHRRCDRRRGGCRQDERRRGRRDYPCQEDILHGCGCRRRLWRRWAPGRRRRTWWWGRTASMRCCFVNCDSRTEEGNQRQMLLYQQNSLSCCYGGHPGQLVSAGGRLLSSDELHPNCSSCLICVMSHDRNTCGLLGEPLVSSGPCMDHI